MKLLLKTYENFHVVGLLQIEFKLNELKNFLSDTSTELRKVFIFIGKI